MSIEQMEFWPQSCAEYALVTNGLFRDEGILKTLDAIVKNKVENGESALRIALSADLLTSTEDWYSEGLAALSVEIKNALSDNLASHPLLQSLNKYPYAVKIIWFRLAYEEYRGDNYQKVFADRFGFPLLQYRSQLMAFAGKEPFKFDDDTAFRAFVWCLRFEKEGNVVNGISSFTARAIRVIDNMEESDACSSESALYSELDYGQDICKHIRNILDGKWRDDFVEFVHVFKNRLCLGGVAPWMTVLYESARRVVVGFRKKEARDAGRPEQLPEIALDYNGNIILRPPSETSYEEGTYCNGDEFRFYRSADVKPCGNWRFVDGIFDCDRRSALLKKLCRIEFINNNVAREITKYLITDAESGIGVYNVCPSRTSCGYSLSYRHPIPYKDGEPEKTYGEPEKTYRLREGEFYKVVSLKGEDLPVIAYSVECPEGRSLPLDEFANVIELQPNVFRVPNGTLKLQIGQLAFYIADSRVDKLVHNRNSRLLCVRNERGGSAGFRFFYRRDVYPVQDTTHVKNLWYEFDGSRAPLPIIVAPKKEWGVPKDWLWHSNGRLVVATDDREERAFPVTFVDVDFSEIEKPFSFGETRHVHLRTGDVFHELDVGPNDVEVDIEYGGVHFRPQINRECVQLCLPWKAITATQGRKPEVEVAYDDICDDAAVLRIQNVDVRNLKFFYGDMLYPLEIPLRQDGTVLFRKLLDVASIRDALPVDCMISPLSGIGAYSFRIYDSKSAVLEVTHGDYEKRVVVDRFADSDDLHIRYFSSFRHHATANKIELAYLLSHRQDEKPRFYPLEERMRADDPQGLGRCVESVVAKDFFKQDIEWGTGVIGFVIERNQYGVSVQTTGFFISAANPAPVCLDDDTLKDLRIALSERQVRRDVPMSEEDRQRLNRIENEFMSDDLQKQAPLREYIRNAASVAMEMNALGSINSFCNAIRNRRGEMAWVSGYVFMAGWFVRDYIEEDGSFSANWPFPSYWSPLLVAYKYKEPIKPTPGEARNVKGVVYRSIEQLFADGSGHASKTENEQLLVRLERMIRNLCPTNSSVSSGMGAFAEGVNNSAKCVFCTRGLETVEHSFKYYQLFETFDVLGLALHQWRMHPTLNEPLLNGRGMPEMTLQDLREHLLFVDEIDRQILGFPWCRELVNSKSAELYFNRNN